MEAQWLITKDLMHYHGYDQRDNTGTGSYQGIQDFMNPCGKVYIKLPYEFRLYDPTGFPCYSGRASWRCLEPLEWANEYAGCVNIAYWNPDTNHWDLAGDLAMLRARQQTRPESARGAWGCLLHLVLGGWLLHTFLGCAQRSISGG